MTTTLPEHLHPAFNWTDSAGEIDELRTLTGDRLAEYCRESAANASENDEDVSEADLLELAEWLKLDHVRSLTPSQAWDEYVGEQSTHEFVENCDGETSEAVEQYLAEMRHRGLTGLEGKSEAHVARLLVRHIEANRAA